MGFSLDTASVEQFWNLRIRGFYWELLCGHHPGLRHVLGGNLNFKEAFEEINEGIAEWSKQLNRAEKTK